MQESLGDSRITDSRITESIRRRLAARRSIRITVFGFVLSIMVCRFVPEIMESQFVLTIDRAPNKCYDNETT